MESPAAGVAASPAQPLPPEVAPGGPLPLTVRQGAIAAILVLAVGLGMALLTPLGAAIEAQRVVPPGAVVVGRASVLPAPGWAVEGRDASTVLLSRAGARMLLRWLPGTPPADPGASLSALAAQTRQDVPDARSFGGVREFTTPTGDEGYLAPFAAPGSTGAIAVVEAPDSQVQVQALAPSTTFASLSDELLGMITEIRIQRRSGS